MNISKLLKKHGKHAHTISKDCNVADAIEKMTLTKSGALIVTENDRPIGILTEHDVFGSDQIFVNRKEQMISH